MSNATCWLDDSTREILGLSEDEPISIEAIREKVAELENEATSVNMGSPHGGYLCKHLHFVSHQEGIERLEAARKFWRELEV
jgi:hypothetical protein